MTSSHFIPDELLSAYLDHQVSEAERRRVEMALAQDPALQERLDALQSVIHLLQSAPAVVVPRPMTISEAQALAAGAFVRGAMPQPGFWQRWMPKLAPLATAIVGVIFVLTLVMPEADLFATFSLPAPFVEQQPAAFQAESIPMPAPTQPRVIVTQVVEKEVERPAPLGLLQAQSQDASASKPLELTAAHRVVSQAAEAQEGVVSVEENAIAVAEEPAAMETANDEALAEKDVAQPQKTYAARWHRPISPLSWLLGALLILLILLTWRVTIAPRRKKRG